MDEKASELPDVEPGLRRRMEPLDRSEALRLLGSVSLGRLVFTQHALPAVRPVYHVLDGEDIVMWLSDGAALASLTAPADGPETVVAYEADVIDPDRHLGWSVVVTGYARLVDDPAELERYRLLLCPWVTRSMTAALRIRPELVTGFQLTDGMECATARSD
ncbi:pyridoxamine 5'-phosphate oxidase family protein [Streptomyces sp. NBC_01167]|uniref:pyridoxamine 5'-phosphate oxidase family protein n=1 Tax=Streptomyces sp. NBC_01167 TaxID=2903756 RepID=UPI00386B219F|nr:pyridoxamine 5'-phosphate oxidase family protein [Streptomyces sp. NBC_01167]